MSRLATPLLAAVLRALLCVSAVAVEQVANVGLILATSGLACTRMAEHWFAALTAIVRKPLCGMFCANMIGSGVYHATASLVLWHTGQLGHDFETRGGCARGHHTV